MAGSTNTKRDPGARPPKPRLPSLCKAGLCTLPSRGRPPALAGQVPTGHGVRMDPAPAVHNWLAFFTVFCCLETRGVPSCRAVHVLPQRDRSTSPGSTAGPTHVQPPAAASEAPLLHLLYSTPSQNTWFWKSDSCTCRAADTGWHMAHHEVPGALVEAAGPERAQEAGRGLPWA